MDEKLTDKEKEVKFVKWVINYVKGMGVSSTVHYDGEDIEEWAVPLSILPLIEKDLLETIR